MNEKKKYLIPIQVFPTSNRGRDMLYEQKKTSKTLDAEKIKKEIDEYLQNYNDDYRLLEVAFYGCDFSQLSAKKQKELLEITAQYVSEKKIKGVQIRINPNCITTENIRFWKKNYVKSLEIIVGSTNDYILKKSKRKYNLDTLKKLRRILRWSFIKYGYIINVGMVDSTDYDEFNTAKNIIKLKPDFVTISPVVVYDRTDLARMYAKEEYQPLSLEQAAQRSKELAYNFRRSGIQDIRIEIYDTDENFKGTTTAENILAGPFHPAFGRYVEGMMWYDSISEKIRKVNSKVKKVDVIINPEDMENATGYSSYNTERFKELYDIDVEIKTDEQIKEGKFEIKIIETY